MGAMISTDLQTTGAVLVLAGDLDVRSTSEIRAALIAGLAPAESSVEHRLRCAGLSAQADWGIRTGFFLHSYSVVISNLLNSKGRQMVQSK